MTEKQKTARQTNWDKRCLTAANKAIKLVEHHARTCENGLNMQFSLRADLRLAASFLVTALDKWPKGKGVTSGRTNQN